jgi:hypothetical protein
MGRGQVKNSGDLRPCTGPEWSRFRLQLFAEWGGMPACWGCGHPVRGPGAGEIQHIIPYSQAPLLGWARSNLRAVHGGGRKRCQACGLACNVIAAGNLCPRDADGRPLGGWSPEFIALARERTEKDRRRSGTGRDRRRPPQTAPEPARTSASGRVFPDAGRPW